MKGKILWAIALMSVAFFCVSCEHLHTANLKIDKTILSSNKLPDNVVKIFDAIAEENRYKCMYFYDGYMLRDCERNWFQIIKFYDYETFYNVKILRYTPDMFKIPEDYIFITEEFLSKYKYYYGPAVSIEKDKI